jgi:cytochrome c
MRILFPVFGLILFMGLLSGCTGGKVLGSYQVATGGNRARGEQVIIHYKCGSCHTIPGIHNANGVFGPPLNELARRSIIGGEFPNEPQNLVRWVMSPTSMKPATAMPDLGLSEQQARDAAAYLETLR